MCTTCVSTRSSSASVSKCFQSCTSPHRHERTRSFVTCFLPHSGGPGTKRRIATEALLHVQKPHEDPQQVQQSAKEEGLRNARASELLTPHRLSHRTSGSRSKHSSFIKIKFTKTDWLIFHFYWLFYEICAYVVLMVIWCRTEHVNIGNVSYTLYISAIVLFFYLL